MSATKPACDFRYCFYVDEKCKYCGRSKPLMEADKAMQRVGVLEAALREIHRYAYGKNPAYAQEIARRALDGETQRVG